MVRGPLGELAVWAADGVRGEITVVISASSGPEVRRPEELVGEVEQKVGEGMRLKDATREVSTVHGVSRRELYEAVLTAREG